MIRKIIISSVFLLTMIGLQAQNLDRITISAGGNATDEVSYSIGETFNFALADGDIYFNTGNIGIGTTNPTSKLRIENGAVTIGVSTESQDKLYIWNYNNQQMGLRKQFGSGVQVFATAGVNNPIFEVVHRAEFDNPLLDEIKFTVLKDGNTGIGTTTPTSKLQVVGLPEYADNAVALAGGLTVGAFYRTGDLLKVVH